MYPWKSAEIYEGMGGGSQEQKNLKNIQQFFLTMKFNAPHMGFVTYITYK